jgi:hypothetical protein
MACAPPRRRHALFVHVPPFEVLGKDTQLLFLVSLLEKLREAILSCPP